MDTTPAAGTTTTAAAIEDIDTDDGPKTLAPSPAALACSALLGPCFSNGQQPGPAAAAAIDMETSPSPDGAEVGNDGRRGACSPSHTHSAKDAYIGSHLADEMEEKGISLAPSMANLGAAEQNGNSGRQDEEPEHEDSVTAATAFTTSATMMDPKADCERSSVKEEGLENSETSTDKEETALIVGSDEAKVGPAAGSQEDQEKALKNQLAAERILKRSPIAQLSERLKRRLKLATFKVLFGVENADLGKVLNKGWAMQGIVRHFSVPLIGFLPFLSLAQLNAVIDTTGLSGLIDQYQPTEASLHLRQSLETVREIAAHAAETDTLASIIHLDPDDEPLQQRSATQAALSCYDPTSKGKNLAPLSAASIATMLNITKPSTLREWFREHHVAGPYVPIPTRPTASARYRSLRGGTPVDRIVHRHGHEAVAAGQGASISTSHGYSPWNLDDDPIVGSCANLKSSTDNLLLMPESSKADSPSPSSSNPATLQETSKPAAAAKTMAMPVMTETAAAKPDQPWQHAGLQLFSAGAQFAGTRPECNDDLTTAPAAPRSIMAFEPPMAGVASHGDGVGNALGPFGDFGDASFGLAPSAEGASGSYFHQFGRNSSSNLESLGLVGSSAGSRATPLPALLPAATRGSVGTARLSGRVSSTAVPGSSPTTTLMAPPRHAPSPLRRLGALNQGELAWHLQNMSAETVAVSAVFSHAFSGGNAPQQTSGTARVAATAVSPSTSGTTAASSKYHQACASFDGAIEEGGKAQSARLEQGRVGWDSADFSTLQDKHERHSMDFGFFDSKTSSGSKTLDWSSELLERDQPTLAPSRVPPVHMPLSSFVAGNLAVDDNRCDYPTSFQAGSFDLPPMQRGSPEPSLTFMQQLHGADASDSRTELQSMVGGQGKMFGYQQSGSSFPMHQQYPQHGERQAQRSQGRILHGQPRQPQQSSHRDDRGFHVQRQQPYQHPRQHQNSQFGYYTHRSNTGARSLVLPSPSFQDSSSIRPRTQHPLPHHLESKSHYNRGHHQPASMLTPCATTQRHTPQFTVDASSNPTLGNHHPHGRNLHHSHQQQHAPQYHHLQQPLRCPPHTSFTRHGNASLNPFPRSAGQYDLTTAASAANGGVGAADAAHLRLSGETSVPESGPPRTVQPPLSSSTQQAPAFHHLQRQLDAPPGSAQELLPALQSHRGGGMPESGDDVRRAEVAAAAAVAAEESEEEFSFLQAMRDAGGLVPIGAGELCADGILSSRDDMCGSSERSVVGNNESLDVGLANGWEAMH
ncbi:hypothetical protein DFJ73DRAFT_965127 [Zopfochytrium polystomum]|nr:hypothetical protein DFJ73DRAFT_965127 [Zopfochytrium polystomum]